MDLRSAGFEHADGAAMGTEDGKRVVMGAVAHPRQRLGKRAVDLRWGAGRGACHATEPRPSDGDCNAHAQGSRRRQVNSGAIWPYQRPMGILTVTLNPALDLETRTAELVPGHKLRCARPRIDPGGGGINVARAIRVLGGEAKAAVAVGGPVGIGLVDRLQKAGHEVAPLPAPGETRQNLSVIEEATGAQYRFIFPGPEWTQADLSAAQAALLPLVNPGDFVVLSGSVPPGLPPTALRDLACALRDAGGAVVADTSGAALAELAAAGLGLKVLRMDMAEAEDLVGRKLATAAETAEVGAELVAAGAAEIAILARGAEGSVLTTATERWFAPAADVPVVSVTGAGDSFVAGATLALSRGMALPDVLCWGACGASAAVTTEATELCDPAVFRLILADCRAERL
jgi:6-phosphofructokinase 2